MLRMPNTTARGIVTSVAKIVRPNHAYSLKRDPAARTLSPSDTLQASIATRSSTLQFRRSMTDQKEAGTLTRIIRSRLPIGRGPAKTMRGKMKNSLTSTARVSTSIEFKGKNPTLMTVIKTRTDSTQFPPKTNPSIKPRKAMAK